MSSPEVEQALSAIEQAVARIRASVGQPPAGEVKVEAVDVTSSSVLVRWSTGRADVTGWTVGRDGQDANGSPPWQTQLDAAAPHEKKFTSLLPGTRYTFFVAPIGGQPVTVSATTDAAAGTSGGTTPPPASGDGTQAAVLQGWGKPVDGDEFDPADYDTKGITKPLSDRWGVYNGAGHNGNGKRIPGAWNVAGGVCTCTGDAALNTGGMAFTRWSGKTYRVEARVQIVALPGTGAPYHSCAPLLWPASDKDWPRYGEDDVAETDVSSGKMQCFLHHPRQSDGGAQFFAEKQVDITQWHNYAAERTGGAVTGWIDGVQWFRTTDPAVLNLPLPMHPCFQLDALDARPKRPAQMRVQWLRIYAPPGTVG